MDDRLGQRRLRRAVLVAAAAAALGQCAAPPPARAPEAPSGYRAKTPQGVDLVFDAQRGAYRVAAAPELYWVDQRFYRRAAGGWQVGPAQDGPWSDCPSGELPPGLRSDAEERP